MGRAVASWRHPSDGSGILEFQRLGTTIRFLRPIEFHLAYTRIMSTRRVLIQWDGSQDETARVRRLPTFPFY